MTFELVLTYITVWSLAYQLDSDKMPIQNSFQKIVANRWLMVRLISEKYPLSELQYSISSI